MVNLLNLKMFLFVDLMNIHNYIMWFLSLTAYWPICKPHRDSGIVPSFNCYRTCGYLSGRFQTLPLRLRSSIPSAVVNFARACKNLC